MRISVLLLSFFLHVALSCPAKINEYHSASKKFAVKHMPKRLDPNLGWLLGPVVVPLSMGAELGLNTKDCVWEVCEEFSPEELKMYMRWFTLMDTDRDKLVSYDVALSGIWAPELQYDDGTRVFQNGSQMMKLIEEIDGNAAMEEERGDDLLNMQQYLTLYYRQKTLNLEQNSKKTELQKNRTGPQGTKLAGDLK